MDWQLTTLAPAFTPMFFGLVRLSEAERPPLQLLVDNIKLLGCFRP